LSYGTFIGQTYANMFPRRVRAIVLDGVLDPVPYTISAQAGIANSTADFDPGVREAPVAVSARGVGARGRRVARSPATARSQRG
jgi:pimeloyl-ACP methyl ester carboxylesterase